MTISNEAVEAAAKALAETCDPLAEWERQGDAYQNIYRRRVMHTLKAVAPIIRAEAFEAAAEERADRSDTYFQTMQNMAESREYELADIVRYGAYSAEANSTAIWLRARAMAERGEE